MSGSSGGDTETEKDSDSGATPSLAGRDKGPAAQSVTHKHQPQALNPRALP